MRWCLGRFQGSVSPGDGEQLIELRSLELSSDAALTSGLLLGLSFTSSIVWTDPSGGKTTKMELQFVYSVSVTVQSNTTTKY